MMDGTAAFLNTKYDAEKYIQYENYLLINGYLRSHDCYSDIDINTDDLVKIIEMYMSKLYLVHLKPDLPLLTEHEKLLHNQFVSHIDEISTNLSDVNFIAFFPTKKILKCQVLLYNEQLQEVFVVSDVKTDTNGVFGTININCTRLIDIRDIIKQQDMFVDYFALSAQCLQKKLLILLFFYLCNMTM